MDLEFMAAHLRMEVSASSILIFRDTPDAGRIMRNEKSYRS